MKREIYYKVLVTKKQAQIILESIDKDCKIPPKGKMLVLSFPDSNIIGYLEWTKAVSEYGDRLFAYSLERYITEEAIA